MVAALAVKNLTKVYGNGFEALKGITLEVQQGDFFALVKIEFLRHHTQHTAGIKGIVINVIAHDSGFALRLLDQATDNAKGGGFASSVGAKQCEEISAGFL